jgi:hypothetical protein
MILLNNLNATEMLLIAERDADLIPEPGATLVRAMADRLREISRGSPPRLVDRKTFAYRDEDLR